jgi:hypothetical protein
MKAVRSSVRGTRPMFIARDPHVIIASISSSSRLHFWHFTHRHFRPASADPGVRLYFVRVRFMSGSGGDAGHIMSHAPLSVASHIAAHITARTCGAPM